MTSIVQAITRKSRNPRSTGDKVALAQSFWSKINHFLPGEIEGNGYAKFCGVNKVHYGLSKNSEWPKISRVLQRTNSKRSANKKYSKNSGVVSKKGNCN